MRVLDLYNQFWNQISKTVGQAEDRIADYISKYPDPSDVLFRMSPSNTALEAIFDIIALELVLPGTRWRYPTYIQRERYARLVSRYNREGYWRIVEVLINQPQGHIYYFKVLNEYFSPEDIFGNILPGVRRKISSLRLESQKERELRLSRRPFKRKVRRRGYSDKGSLRPAHTWLPDNAYSRPELPVQPEVTFRAPKPFQWLPQDKQRFRDRSYTPPSRWAEHFRENYRKMYPPTKRSDE